MSFTDDVLAGATKTGSRCSVAVWREQFVLVDPVGAEEFDTLIADPTVQGRAIWAAMRARGYGPGQQSVTRHRRGDCQCPSPMM